MTDSFNTFLSKYLSNFVVNIATVMGLLKILELLYRLSKTFWRQLIRPCF